LGKTIDLKNLLVINYHRILGRGEASGPGTGQVYDVRLEDFEQQLQLMSQEKYNLVSLQHAEQEMVEGKLNIAISFDDGCESDWKIAFPLLAEKGIPASFFIVPGRPVNWTKIQELHRYGFTIGSHGLTHYSLAKLKVERCAFEMKESAKIISDQLSAPVDLLAFPFGQYNPTCIHLAQAAGYRHGFTTRFRLNQSPNGFLHHDLKTIKTTGLGQFSRVLNQHTFEHFYRQTYSGLVFNMTNLVGHTFMNRLNATLNRS